MIASQSEPLPAHHGLLTLVHTGIAVLAIFFLTRSSAWALGSAFVMAGSGYFVARAPSRVRIVAGIYVAAGMSIAAFYLLRHGTGATPS